MGPLSQTFETGPDSDPSGTTLTLAITTLSYPGYYSRLLIGLPCFLPCQVQSVFCKQPERFLYNTKSDPIPPLLKILLWSHLTWSQSQHFFNRLPHLCHPLPSPPYVLCSPSTGPHCSLLFFMQGKPTPTSGPLHSQLPLLDCSSSDFQSLLETITPFGFLCREAFPANLFKTACPPHLHQSQSLSLLCMPFLMLITTWHIKLSLVYSLCPFQKVNIPGRESTLYS